MARKCYKLGRLFTGVPCYYSGEYMKIAAILSFAVLTAAAAEMALVQPKDLAAQLQGKGAKPYLFHVGFNVLYRSKHIPNSFYVGPGATAALRAAVEKLPRDADLVIYCGCCPWDHCPNIKPAMEMLKQMGFTKARALYIPTNMSKDWYDPGYPTEAGTAANPGN